MKILLTPIGSHGDVHPFTALGRELARRGHHVAVATNETFQPLIERVGLQFIQNGTAAQYQEVLRRPEIWHPTQGAQLLFHYLVGDLLRDLYKIIADNAGGEPTVVVAPATAFAARIAQEKLGIPLVTIHLAPSSLRSITDPPVLPGMPLPGWTPLWLRRGLFWFGDVCIIDRIVAGPLNAFRKELGLPPARRIIDQWWNSPERIIGLFPEWFAAARDWPPQLRLTGFPLYDERDTHELPRDVEDFLHAGSSPFVFTPGSANAQGAAFFQAAVDACRQLQRRALFLTVHAEHVPPQLPAGIKHVRYIPFSLVLPHAAAIVHHGGIGTTAQALAAGVPQLVMPMGFDQLDNAARCERLGAARVLPPRRFTGANVARALQELTASRERCAEIAKRFAGHDSVAQACDMIENTAKETSAPQSPASLTAAL